MSPYRNELYSLDGLQDWDILQTIREETTSFYRFLESWKKITPSHPESLLFDDLFSKYMVAVDYLQRCQYERFLQIWLLIMVREDLWSDQLILMEGTEGGLYSAEDKSSSCLNAFGVVNLARVSLLEELVNHVLTKRERIRIQSFVNPLQAIKLKREMTVLLQFFVEAFDKKRTFLSSNFQQIFQASLKVIRTASVA